MKFNRCTERTVQSVQQNFSELNYHTMCSIIKTITIERSHVYYAISRLYAKCWYYFSNSQGSPIK